MSRVWTVFGGCGTGKTCGAERMAWRTTQALAEAGHQVSVLTTAERPADLADVGWAAPSTERPDVVHAYDLAEPKEVAMARELADRHGARFVLTPASSPAVWPDQALGASLCRQADAVFTLTEQEAEHIRQLGVDHSRIVMIPSAPDLVGTADPAGVRKRLGIDGDIVLFLSRKLPSKGYQALLDATTQVWRHAPDTTFVFAGPGPNVATGEVRDLGMVDDQTKHDLIAACTVLCLPTTHDVFPLVFMEAWSCGKPVVSGDFPGVHSVVHDGVDGLIAPATATGVAEALTRLLLDESLRSALGAAGLRRVREGMTWRRVAERVSAHFAGCDTPGGHAA